MIKKQLKLKTDPTKHTRNPQKPIREKQLFAQWSCHARQPFIDEDAYKPE